MVKAKTTEDTLIEQVATMQKQIADLQKQCDAFFKKHGLPSWTKQEKERRENKLAAATKTPFHPTDAFGEIHQPKPHEVTP